MGAVVREIPASSISISTSRSLSRGEPVNVRSPLLWDPDRWIISQLKSIDKRTAELWEKKNNIKSCNWLWKFDKKKNQVPRFSIALVGGKILLNEQYIFFILIDQNWADPCFQSRAIVFYGTRKIVDLQPYWKFCCFKLLHASEGKDECTEINLYDVVKKTWLKLC